MVVVHDLLLVDCESDDHGRGVREKLRGGGCVFEDESEYRRIEFRMFTGVI